MRSNRLLLLLFLITVTSTYALECQYTTDVPIERVVEQWYCSERPVDGRVYIEKAYPDFPVTGIVRTIATVRNEFPFGVTVRVVFPELVRHYAEDIVTVPAGGVVNASVTGGRSGKGAYLGVIEPDCLKKQNEVRIVNETVCLQCGAEQCRDDGDSCSSARECGSGFCVEGVCSPNQYCYLGNCDCGLGEVQCPDASRCVERKSVPVGAVYECSPLECENGYGEDGICVFSAVQLSERDAAAAAAQRVEEQELDAQRKTERRNTTLFILGVIVGIPAIIASGKATYKLLSEYAIVSKFRAMAATDHARIMLIEKKERSLQNKHDRENKEQILQELKRIKKERAEPHETIYDFGPEYQQWLNPDKGNYPCFVVNGEKTDRLIDREIAEEEIFKPHQETFYNMRYPGIPFSELVVHHIDNERTNYEKKNLVIISKKEKSRLDLPKIVDRKSGMEELKRIGASARHIPGLP